MSLTPAKTDLSNVHLRLLPGSPKPVLAQWFLLSVDVESTGGWVEFSHEGEMGQCVQIACWE